MIEERLVTYDDLSTRRFLWASVLWGAVGMLVGVIIATQLAFWQANGSGNLPWNRCPGSSSAACAPCTPTR